MTSAVFGCGGAAVWWVVPIDRLVCGCWFGWLCGFLLSITVGAAVVFV